MELHIPLAAHGFACKFSPYNGALACAQLAVVSSQHYGLAGNGKAQVFALHDEGKVAELAAFDTAQAVFDMAWSECNAFQLVTGSADGGVCLWDIRASDGLPLAKVFTHSQEVSTVAWDIHSKCQFASASWDGSAMLFDATTLQQTGRLVSGTSGHVYDIEWHPVTRGLLATTIGTNAAIWDTTTGLEAAKFVASPHDVLSVTWNKYDSFSLATAGADGTLRCWDTRALRYPVMSVGSHSLPIRRARFSPFDCTIASASYDTTVGLWNAQVPERVGGNLLRSCTHHSEFVCGLDWDVAVPGRLASCGWDRQVVCWTMG